jgi:hypothetical protein
LRLLVAGFRFGNGKHFNCPYYARRNPVNSLWRDRTPAAIGIAMSRWRNRDDRERLPCG